MICQKKGCENPILKGLLCVACSTTFLKSYSAMLDREDHREIVRLEIKIIGLKAELKAEKHKSMMLTNKCKRYRQGRTQ